MSRVDELIWMWREAQPDKWLSGDARHGFEYGWDSLSDALRARCQELRAGGHQALADSVERVLEEVEGNG